MSLGLSLNISRTDSQFNRNRPPCNLSKIYEIITDISSKMVPLDSEKRMYGALLPKAGNYFLPDEKIIGFLKYDPKLS